MGVTAEALADWTARLVRIPSVNPAQAGPRAGTPGEALIAARVEEWFRAFGGETHVEARFPERPMVCGIWRGTTDRWVALDVHVDTVGVETMLGDPFSGEIRDGRVWGRGAVDTKASLGVALALLEDLHRRGVRPGPNVLVAATVDEEVGAQGAPQFRDWVRAQGLELDELMVAEPTQCGPVHGHKGGVRVELEVLGEPAHSSQPHLGRNAITAGAALALALHEEHQRLQAEPPATDLGSPTLTVTLVRGGVGTNVVPPSCTLVLDRRMVPGEDGLVVGAEIAALAGRACPLPVRARSVLHFPAYYQPTSGRWLGQLAESSGRAPSVVPYGTNAWAYGGLAGECVVLGPGSIDQAHGVEEWVAVAELERLSQIYAHWWR